MPTNQQPRYLQIANLLRQQIEKGNPAVGSLLPTEQQLCDRYLISRHTVREALRLLEKDQMVVRRQGSGTTVIARARQSLNHNISSVADMLQYAANSRLAVLSATRILANDTLAKLIDCKPGTDLVHIHALRSVEKGASPFCISDIYRVAGNDAVTKRLLAVSGAIYALIDELALNHISTVEQKISATTLTAANANVLRVPKLSVGLKIVRRYLDADNKLILAAVNLHPGANFQYSMTLNHRKK